MAKGKKHRVINIVLLPIIIYALDSLSVFDTIHIFIFSFAYLYGTYYFHPDLDLSNQIKLLSFRGFMTLPLRMIYSPFFKHRGMSHSVFLGTISRVLALICFLLLIFFFYLTLNKLISTGFISTSEIKNLGENIFWGDNLSLKEILRLFFSHPKESLSIFLGFFFSDIVHLGADKIRWV